MIPQMFLAMNEAQRLHINHAGVEVGGVVKLYRGRTMSECLNVARNPEFDLWLGLGSTLSINENFIVYISSL